MHSGIAINDTIQSVSLLNNFDRLSYYVESKSDGDKAKIESAGFSVRNPPAPIGQLPAPTDLQVVASEFAGSADLNWKSGRGSRAFTIERAEDAPVPEYEVIGTSTKKYASFNSMVSGKKYWFRVAAIGAAGQSAWSDPVPLFAP
ncbi:MAG: fibronectin type III domain-containing protein [Verrucomicrobiota bacterium]